MRAMRTIDLSGRNGVIFGVANQRSLAWAIAEALDAAGARLAFTYQGERIEENVRGLASRCEGSLVLPCDVTQDAEIDAVFHEVGREFGRLDYLVHSVAFARREDLDGAFHETSRDGWRTALDISAYSLVALAGRASRLMKPEEGGSIITLSYIASQRVFPNYNVMGSAKAALEHAVRQLAFELGERNIRVNAISAGPVSTLSARGISGFTQMIGYARERSPLRRNIEAREVGDAALFLLSPLATGITGTTLYVDAGYNIMGI
jgi:enoyl-[acyl-carrier protein] reductase I